MKNNYNLNDKPDKYMNIFRQAAELSSYSITDDLDARMFADSFNENDKLKYLLPIMEELMKICDKKYDESLAKSCANNLVNKRHIEGTNYCLMKILFDSRIEGNTTEIRITSGLALKLNLESIRCFNSSVREKLIVYISVKTEQMLDLFDFIPQIKVIAQIVRETLFNRLFTPIGLSHDDLIERTNEDNGATKLILGIQECECQEQAVYYIHDSIYHRLAFAMSFGKLPAAMDTIVRNLNSFFAYSINNKLYLVQIEALNIAKNIADYRCGSRLIQQFLPFVFKILHTESDDPLAETCREKALSCLMHIIVVLPSICDFISEIEFTLKLASVELDKFIGIHGVEKVSDLKSLISSLQRESSLLLHNSQFKTSNEILTKTFTEHMMPILIGFSKMKLDISLRSIKEQRINNILKLCNKAAFETKQINDMALATSLSFFNSDNLHDTRIESGIKLKKILRQNYHDLFPNLRISIRTKLLSFFETIDEEETEYSQEIEKLSSSLILVIFKQGEELLLAKNEFWPKIIDMISEGSTNFGDDGKVSKACIKGLSLLDELLHSKGFLFMTRKLDDVMIALLDKFSSLIELFHCEMLLGDDILDKIMSCCLSLSSNAPMILTDKWERYNEFLEVLNLISSKSYKYSALVLNIVIEICIYKPKSITFCMNEILNPLKVKYHPVWHHIELINFKKVCECEHKIQICLWNDIRVYSDHEKLKVLYDFLIFIKENRKNG